MNAWPKIEFSDLVSDETGGNTKTLQSDYLSTGDYPIVDQGQSLVGGYTNDASRLCKADLPVIIFGDHTKCFKFIDFPFCLGADGTKVLRPKQSMDERYLYYALQRIHIPDAGYSRHFKYLKEGKVPLPPLAEQKRIAAILDQADELRRKRQLATDRLNKLGQAIFHEMFGDPFENKTNETVELRSLTNRITYGFTSPMSHHNSGIPILTAKNVRDGYIDFESCVFANQSEFDRLTDKCKPDKGDILVTKDGTIGRCSVFDADIACINQSVCLVKPKHDMVRSSYLSSYIRSQSVQSRIQAMKKGNAIAHLQITEFASFPIICAPMPLQIEFERRLDRLERVANSFRHSSRKMQQIFASLQDRAFGRTL